MVTERLEVRLDAEHRRRLADIAAARRAPVSTIVREMIDQAYEEILHADRLCAAEELARLAAEDVPDPATLRRQIEDTYEQPDLR